MHQGRIAPLSVERVALPGDGATSPGILLVVGEDVDDLQVGQNSDIELGRDLSTAMRRPRQGRSRDRRTRAVPVGENSS